MNYFAAGWFTPKQNELYDKLTKILKKNSVLEWFIPRDLGIDFAEKSPEEKKLLTNKVFALDTGMILLTAKTDGFILAVIDDYDTGMVFECGFAFGISLGKLPIVTYTDENYGLNVMLRQSAMAHIRGVKQLETFLYCYIEMGANTAGLVETAKLYQNFSEEIF